MTTTCCTSTNTLNVFIPNADKPWNEIRVKHLYNRIGFGVSKSLINQGLLISPDQLVNQIMDAAINNPLPPVPNWVNWDYDEHLVANQCYDEDSNGIPLSVAVRDIFTVGAWLRSIANEINRFRFKMAMFWHGHFVTEENKYNNIVYMLSLIHI